MTVPAKKTQKARLSQLLPERGWRVARVERDDLDWWAEEMWLLESLGSPVGYPTYLTFLVDPQGSGLARGVGDAVWAVLASPSKPATWLEGADASRFGLGRHWADGMPALFEYLASLRFNALNVRTAGPSEQSQ